jgi:hypothetical protein
MSKRTWYEGNPPSIGWYNACIYKLDDTWKYWNGKYWSMNVYEEDSIVIVAQFSALEDTSPNIIWTTFWPENPRVEDNREKFIFPKVKLTLKERYNKFIVYTTTYLLSYR